MTQIVGLFLGGTGKYVAELLKGWAREYRWDFNNFAVFDVDTLEQLRGPYELGDDLVPPPNDFTVLVDRVIAQWAEDDVARDTSRGSRAFETSVLYNVARGLTREKLAPNSGLWTLRSTGLPATQALANAGAGQDAVTNAVGAANQLVQNRGNDGVQLMVVASSAGGTGSGFTVPFALQARRGFGDAPVEIVTLLAGASAFEKTWKDNDSNIRSRGLSGTFAVFREIDFLSAKPEEFSTPGVREIPAAGGLRYFEDNPVALQPGTPVASYQLARTAYWVGRRSRIDTVADAYACLQELARFYAALSNAGLASAINTRPVMQSSPLALTPGIVSVEYRRLEVAERVAADLLIAALKNEVLGQAPGIAAQTASYFAQPPQQSDAVESYPYATFARNIKTQVFTNQGDVGASRIPPEHLESFLISLAPGVTMSSEDPPTDDERLKTATVWSDMVTDLTTRMDQRLEAMTQAQRRAVDTHVTNELTRTDAWLRQEVIARELNRPGKVRNVQAGLRNIRKELTEVRHFYTVRQWDEGLVRDAPPVPKLEDAVSALETAKKSMEPEASGPQRARRGPWDTFVRFMGCIASGAALGGIVWLFLATLWPTLVAAAFGAVVTLYLTRPRPQRGKTTAQLRLDAFVALRDAYENLLLARRADYAWIQARDYLYAQLVDEEGTGADSVLRKADREVAALETLSSALQSIEEAQAQARSVLPPCVIQAVGDDQQLTAPQITALSLAIRRRISFHVSDHGDPLITLHITPENTTPQQFLVPRPAEQVDDNAAAAREILDALEALARLETTGAHILFEDFAAACPNDVQLAQYLDRLGQAAINRGPSSPFASAGQPSESFLLVGSPEISVRVSNLLANGSIQNSASLARLTAGLRNNGARQEPILCPNIGQAVLLLELWGAVDTRNLEEYTNSLGVYYSLGERPDRRQPPQRYSAANFPFHLIPELDTASHIETAARYDKPLAGHIVQRLRGSDPRMFGPTTLLLYYLARVHDLFKEIEEPDETTLTVIESGTHEVPLVRKTPAPDPPGGDPLGDARDSINLFDAFADLMSYSGQNLAAGMFTRLSGLGAEVESSSWSVLYQRGAIQSVQKDVRQLFWQLKPDKALADKTFKELTACAEKDAELMDRDLQRQWKVVTEYVFRQQRTLLR